MRTVLFGIVKDNADPEGLGRVQVDLLDFGDVTLPWIPVLQAFAGKTGGALVMPEAGEHVVVLVGDSGFPIDMVVIGSMYTPKTVPPALAGGKAGDPAVRGLVTPAGHEIVVSDEPGKEAITVQTKDAAVSVVFDGVQTTLTLTAKTEISVQCPNGMVTVKAQQATIDAGTATVKGSTGGVVVNGGAGPVDVTGSTINISGSGNVTISAPAIMIG